MRDSSGNSHSGRLTGFLSEEKQPNRVAYAPDFSSIGFFGKIPARNRRFFPRWVFLFAPVLMYSTRKGEAVIRRLRGKRLRSRSLTVKSTVAFHRSRGAANLHSVLVQDSVHRKTHKNTEKHQLWSAGGCFVPIGQRWISFMTVEGLRR